MHHLSYFSDDKYCNNDNIKLYKVECDKNMTKSYHILFPIF